MQPSKRSLALTLILSFAALLGFCLLCYMMIKLLNKLRETEVDALEQPSQREESAQQAKESNSEKEVDELMALFLEQEYSHTTISFG